VGTDINIYECIDFNQSVDPYGAVMWPGALALCSFLENNRDMVNLEDKQVLELGSGTGLVAIVASLLGAKVTATDLPNFLGNLRANVMRNIRGRSRHIPQICPLTWSFDVGRIYPSHLHRFDFVLAADVVYHHHYLDELLATMSHFCHPRTTIIWANKLRIPLLLNNAVHLSEQLIFDWPLLGFAMLAKMLFVFPFAQNKNNSI
uniref:Si:ch73-244f7.3 n=1 Tax=Neogobius melanostomus TaxID=47308 RepID=A0A8C6TT75_9GOBI